MVRSLIALCAIGIVASPAQARACSGTPVGPAGIAASCAQPDPDERTLRIGASVGWVTLEHNYGHGGGELRRRTTAVTLSWRALDSITLMGDVGAITGGDITAGPDRYTIEPGARGGLGITWRALDDEPWLPFIVLGASFSVLSTLTELDEIRTRMSEIDFRSSILIGKLFGNRGKIGPYIVARTITGAMYWKFDGRVRSVRPADVYQIGLGLSASAGDFDAYAEATPFGERSMVFGLGFSF